MARLDLEYIASLVTSAQEGDSNAFAELFLATYKDQYIFCYRYLQSEVLAQEALQETYIAALRSIGNIQDNHIFLSWISQVNFRICFNLKGQHLGDGKSPETKLINIDGEEYIARQILDLPSSEARAILMFYYDEMTIDKVAHLMDCSTKEVRQYIANGRRRLEKLLNR